MYNVRKVTKDYYWIGANDRRLALFEGVYKIPKGVSYNSYVLLDEKTVVFDTVDASASKQYLENLAHVLGGRRLDYVIVQHMDCLLYTSPLDRAREDQEIRVLRIRG